MKGAYRTVSRRGESLHVVQKSKFLGLCVPVAGETEAASAIEAQRKKTYDARHHCYAFIAGQHRRSSDDGEPAGTAGMPILEVLANNGMNNVLIVVTRYFGGVLLGTGGLARAYSAAATRALDDALPVTMHAAVYYNIKLDYARYSRLPALLKSVRTKMLREDFGADVSADLAVREEDAEAFRRLYEELAGGEGFMRETCRGHDVWQEDDCKD